ncbi:lamin tail domain-containing protein [Natrinema zhouii]|uniref:Lamin tail domain-containing protein n=1 Tax=Natrinema zhouii TaxID=1710539 RepID=A0A7D6H0B9_9EURY|nr:lamin tail domain-containing protein [Natrinema zhouii]QLK26545.1 lamin tail domain-containing protein [Natrinema zhouii]
MRLNRRRFIAGTALAAAGIGISGNVLADGHELPVKIVEVNPTEETVILENTGSETVDLGGYLLDWEHENDEDQTKAFEEGVTIEPGKQLSVWSGFQSTQIGDVKADYQIADYDHGRINDQDPDVIALLSPEGELVATSDGYTSGGDNSSGDNSGSDSDSDTDSDNTGDESSADTDETTNDDTDVESDSDTGDEDAGGEADEDVNANADEEEEAEAEAEAEDDC